MRHRIALNMSPIAHLLQELRVGRGLRQTELAERIGYEQSYISALEVGLKGPPTPEFIGRFVSALSLSQSEAGELLTAAVESQRKFVIELDTPREGYRLMTRLCAALPALTPTQIRVIDDVLSMGAALPGVGPNLQRRLPRRRKEAPQM